MRLWIDGSVPPPADFQDWAMNGDDAIAVIESGKVTHVSIGYDLDGRWTGFSLLLWMRQTGRWPLHGVHVHGGTKVQREEMVDLCRRRYF